MNEPASFAFAAPDHAPDIDLKALPEDERLCVLQAPRFAYDDLHANFCLQPFSRTRRRNSAGVG